MTAAKRAEMMQTAMGEDGKVNLTELWPMLIVATTYDPDTGDPVFTTDDIEALLGKSAAVIEMLGTEAMNLSGMRDDSVDEAGKES